MANPSSLGAICYEAESAASAWAEEVTTFATHRLPLVAPLDVSGLVHEKVAAGRLEQYRNSGSQWILMTQSGSFSMTLDLAGHGTTTAGTPSLDAIETFLGIVFGTTPALSLATSQTMTGGTAAIPTASGATGITAGGIVGMGALGDGDGDGQMYAVSGHSGSSVTLLGAMNGAPVNGAVIYPTVMIYPSSAPTTGAITGTRFLLQTANLQYRCHGCWPQSVSFANLNTGGRPQITITWGVSRWSYSISTFPSTVTSNQYNPAPVAAGSFNVQDVGTTTRNARAMRNFTLDYTLGVRPLMGPTNGVGGSAYQTVVGARRIDDQIKLSWTEDADAATTTPVLPGYGTSTTSKYVMYTASCTPGSAFGLWFPKVCISNVAVQKAEDNINRLTVTADAYTGGTLTSELTRAAMVLCLR